MRRNLLTFVRKVVVVLVGISLAVLMTVLLLNPNSIEQLAVSLSDTSTLIRLPLTILVDVIILLVIFVLVRSERSPRSANGLMVKAQGAITDVSVNSARDRILRAVRDVPDVLSAEASVKALHGKADVDLDVVVSHESGNLPEKQREIDRALRQVINKQLGLQMAGKPHVHIRMDDEHLLTPSSEAPASAAVAPVEPVKAADASASEAALDEPALPEPDFSSAMTVRADETDQAAPESPDTPAAG